MCDHIQAEPLQADHLHPDSLVPCQLQGVLERPLVTGVVNGSEHPISSVRDWIRLEYDMIRGNLEPRMWPFDGPRDFVLRLGRDFPSRPLPQGVRRGLPRQCFHNAASLALRRPQEFLYVEGYAFTKGLCTEHAWCVDREGYAVDPTWQGTHEAHYFGVPFFHPYVRRRGRERGELGGLINVWEGEEKFPLCTEAHPLSEAVADLGEWITPEADGAELEGDREYRL